MKKNRLFIIVGTLLILSAMALSAYNILIGRRAVKLSGQALEQLAPVIREAVLPKEESLPLTEKDRNRDVPPPQNGIKEQEESPENKAPLVREEVYPDYILNPDMDMPVKKVDRHPYIGILSFPKLGLNLPILESWNYSELNVAPCRYSGTAYLNNLIICGHNYRQHFGILKNLQYGEEVVLTDMDGNEFYYYVTETQHLPPTAVEEMERGDWDLTLFTCTAGGMSRIAVRCRKTAERPGGAF